VVSIMTVSSGAAWGAEGLGGEAGAGAAEAKRLDYQPDPHLTRMMQVVRGKKETRVRAVIAVIREHVPQDGLLGPSYQYVPIEDIRHRAHGHGYAVEEFYLGKDGLTPKKLQKILHARGIEGVIVSPQSMQLPCSKLDYSPFRRGDIWQCHEHARAAHVRGKHDAGHSHGRGAARMRAATGASAWR
jgi:hypothetical protein